jgi:Metallo-peptidase family M12B Reprolysin-like
MATNRYLAAALVAVLAALTAPGLVSARPLKGARMDRAQDCEETIPEAIVTTPAGSGQTVNLDVLVLNDGASKVDAHSVMAKAAEAYVPLKIELRATLRKVALPGDTDNVSTGDALDLIEQARAAVGGVRPAGFDIVYVITSKDIRLASDTDAAGQADCIGGVRYADRAFAIGEVSTEQEKVGGLNFYLDGSAKIAAHEIGHLLGARHEHGNCVEGIGVEDVGNSEPSACTLMFNTLDFQSLKFGTPEAQIVRGHAEQYAAP